MKLYLPLTWNCTSHLDETVPPTYKPAKYVAVGGRQFGLLCSFVFVAHIFNVRPVYHLPIINTCRNVQQFLILSSEVHKSILCAKHNHTGIQDTRPHFWRSPTHLASLCSWYIALMHGTWLFGIIRTRWSSFCLFNPKSELWWWCIVNTHGLPCTFTLFFAHCTSWHFRPFHLEWFYTFQKYIFHWRSRDHKCSLSFYPKASLFHTSSWKVVSPVLCHSRMDRCFLSDLWRDD